MRKLQKPRVKRAATKVRAYAGEGNGNCKC